MPGDAGLHEVRGELAPVAGALQDLLLVSLSIHRFRSLDEVDALPLQHDMTVLTGENDGGKTTAIDALAFLLGGYTPDADDWNQETEGDDALVVEGTFVSRDDAHKGLALRVRARWTPTEKAQEVLDRVHPGFGVPPGQLSLADLRVKLRELSIDGPGGSAKAPFVTAAESWLATRPDEDFVDSWRPITAEEKARLPSLTRFESVEAPSPTAHIQGVIARESRRLLAHEAYADRLVTLERDLDRDVGPALDRIRSKIREYCPDLDDVEVRASFDFARPAATVEVRVHRAGEMIDLEKSGEGRKRRIALAIHEANLAALEEEGTGPTEILAYDEPDTHLDYTSQRQLYEILRRQARLAHVQVLVATHSLNFIDKVPLEALLHFRLDSHMHTTVETLRSQSHEEEEEFLASVCAGLGLRNSLLLDERCFLVVEGDTEEYALPQLFRIATGQSLIAAGVTLFNMRGSRQVRRLVEVLRNEWKRTVVLLVDSDTRADIGDWAKHIGLVENDDLYFIGQKEFEDSFSDEVWLGVVARSFAPADGGGDWTLEQITQLHDQEEPFSVALRNLVRARVRDASVGKPALGLALAQHVASPGDFPPILIRSFERALSVSRP